VYAFIEPDQGGQAFLDALRKSRHAERIKIVRLEGYKDASELHCKAWEEFDEVLRQATLNAAPLASVEAREAPQQEAKPGKAKAEKSKKGEGEEKRSLADLIADIATDRADIFAAMPNGEVAYASMIVDGHRETWPLRS